MRHRPTFYYYCWKM